MCYKIITRWLLFQERYNFQSDNINKLGNLNLKYLHLTNIVWEGMHYIPSQTLTYSCDVIFLVVLLGQCFNIGKTQNILFPNFRKTRCWIWKWEIFIGKRCPYILKPTLSVMFLLFIFTAQFLLHFFHSSFSKNRNHNNLI